MLRRIGWFQKAEDERLRFNGAVRLPEGAIEGDIDLLQAAISNVIDGFRHLEGKRWCESLLVVLEPTKGASDYKLIVSQLLTICQKHRNPFGSSIQDIVRTDSLDLRIESYFHLVLAFMVDFCKN